MPELPEVEVIRRELAPLICGKSFAEPVLFYERAIRYPRPKEFSRRLPGRCIVELGRKGKYLFFELDRGLLLGHLRMTGKLLYCAPGAALDNPTAPEKDLRVKLPFAEGGALYFYDMRKFGGFWLLEDLEECRAAGLSLPGPDIWEELDESTFVAMLQGRPRARIKPLLLDQHFAAGMGNIYTDESLFRSGIHPCRRVQTLTEEESALLYRTIRDVLAAGIACGGTTTRDYRDARGAEGSFQNFLTVYGRKGEPCTHCSRPIERIVVAGRGTHFCPHCQK
ncbi:MAG: bifunctional DNA-formamidopyrimidine glycosylase/DNA-(apurinic or apyrimidinic site) lyase [Firmicutes bacterium]|nr:bifunctional DNA-formamidopyrimidine glycosylase/DNA-(apurinic or apyrimidinic site) lyase [Bacillota bacterium]